MIKSETKVFDYIEELERKAKESEKYFKLWHEEKIKNNKATEYIKSYMPNYDFDKTNLIKVLDILEGDDKE